MPTDVQDSAFICYFISHYYYYWLQSGATFTDCEPGMCLAKYADVVELEALPELYGELNVPLWNADTVQETFANMPDAAYVTLVVEKGRLGLEWPRLDVFEYLQVTR